MGKGNNQNTFKFKINVSSQPRAEMDDYKGYVEFIGCPTVKDLVEWALRRPNESGILSIGYGDLGQNEFTDGKLRPSAKHPDMPIDPFMTRRIQTIRCEGGETYYEYQIFMK